VRTPSPPEWLALIEGHKPALRLWSAAGRAAAEAAAARRRGFAVEEVAAPGAGKVIVYVARTPAAARALRELEAPILPGQPIRPLAPADLDAHRGLGAALGFPACCVDAFVARVERGVDRLANHQRAHEDFVAMSEAVARSRVLRSLLNMFAADRSPGWVSHVVCRLDCDASIAYASAVRATCLRVDPEGARALDRALARDVAIGRDGRRSDLADADADACRLAFAKELDPA
jgi:hypothetical protein